MITPANRNAAVIIVNRRLDYEFVIIAPVLSKSNISSHKINGFHEIQYCLRNPRICMHDAFNREHSTRMLKFKSRRFPPHVRWPDNVGG